ncbi:hypothetical protein GGTG_11528 [Gaeumannomyces tritici R3-111a-1]|uniref:Uncharacterized protein n=1 Tax=Gaeumannomyces tritici (strain R3-111a-1) TaxID=644352 RepID=J3PDF7_GAET3|nr:hypothetical protein GGTG_11528 [Gaeumannomyces tritici R3-111a-1]EJT70505.1 hypothetical protein GGTG_11528 [Gaeumannomyces tritici R3-111a-1]
MPPRPPKKAQISAPIQPEKPLWLSSNPQRIANRPAAPHKQASFAGPQERYGFYYISNLAPDEAILFIDYDSQLQQAAAAAAAAEAAKIRTVTTGRFQALRTARSRTIMPLKRRYGGG